MTAAPLRLQTGYSEYGAAKHARQRVTSPPSEAAGRVDRQGLSQVPLVLPVRDPPGDGYGHQHIAGFGCDVDCIDVEASSREHGLGGHLANAFKSASPCRSDA